MKFLLFAMVVVSCGPNPETSNSVYLKLKFPKSIPYQSPRYAAFLATARNMKVNLQTRSLSRVFNFSVQDWEGMLLPDLPFQTHETVKIRVEIWNEDKKGALRTYPILTGKKTFQIEPGETRLTLNLHEA